MFYDLGASASAILAAWFTALLFGVLLTVAVFYIRLAILQGLNSNTKRIMCGLVVVQLLLSGAHNGLCLGQVLYGFQAAPIPDVYFSDQGQPAHVAQSAMYLFNNLIADSVLVWRLYVVCQKDRRIFIPYSILILGSLTVAIGILHTVSGRDNFSKLFANKLAGWSETYWGLTITTQVSASCLIAYRIWKVQRQSAIVRPGLASKSMSVVWMILESGATLSFTSVVLLAFYVQHKVSGGVIAAVCGQLAGLIPATILLRVALNRVPLAHVEAIPLPGLTGPQNDVESTAGSSIDRAKVHVHQIVEIQEYHG